MRFFSRWRRRKAAATPSPVTSELSSTSDDGYESSEDTNSLSSSFATTTNATTNLTTNRSDFDSNDSDTFSSEISEKDRHKEEESEPEEDTTDCPEKVAPRGRRSERHRSRSFSRRSTNRSTNRSKSVDSLNKRINNRKSRWDRQLTAPVETTVIAIRTTPALKEQGEKFLQLKTDPQLQEEWNKRFPDGAIVAYTDGSCFNKTHSGFGIFFGPGHPLNRAERVDGPIHNSCLTEIIAAQRALTLLKQWADYKNEAVILRTDFLPLVQSMHKRVSKRAIFANYYRQLLSLAKEMPAGVQFQHVYGHGDDPGNQAADELARQAALSSDERRRTRSVSCVRVKENRGRGRSASRSNNRQHIRSHSAFVRGRA